MKKISILRDLLIFVFFMCISYTVINAQNISSPKQIIPMLNKFYLDYIVMVAKGQFTNNERDLFLAKYCTKRMMDYLQNCKCEYDPFLRAQDADTLSLNTLIIRKDSITNNLYRVTYTDHYSKVKINIGLFVIKQNCYFKIDSFW